MELVTALNRQQRHLLLSFVNKRVLRKIRTHPFIHTFYTRFYAEGYLFEARMLPATFSVSFYNDTSPDPVLCYHEQVRQFSRKAFRDKFLTYVNKLCDNFQEAFGGHSPFVHIPKRWSIDYPYRDIVHNSVFYDCCGGLFFVKGRLRRTLHHLGAERR